MDFYRAYKLGRLFLAGGLLVVAGCVVTTICTVNRIREEVDYHARFGPDWVSHYEADQGPLAQTNLRIALGIAYLLGLIAFLVWVYKRNRPQFPRRRRNPRHL